MLRNKSLCNYMLSVFIDLGVSCDCFFSACFLIDFCVSSLYVFHARSWKGDEHSKCSLSIIFSNISQRKQKYEKYAKSYYQAKKLLPKAISQTGNQRQLAILSRTNFLVSETYLNFAPSFKLCWCHTLFIITNSTIKFIMFWDILMFD